MKFVLILSVTCTRHRTSGVLSVMSKTVKDPKFHLSVCLSVCLSIPPSTPLSLSLYIYIYIYIYEDFCIVIMHNDVGYNPCSAPRVVSVALPT